MANMNKQKHDKLYPEIVEKQRGEYCVACQRDRFILRQLNRNDTLCIDHIDNNNENNDISNLQLLCRGCNTMKNHWRMLPNVEELDDAPTYKKSKQNEFRFRNYCMGRLQEPEANYKVKWDDIKADASEACKISLKCAGDYLTKMVSPREGIFDKKVLNDGEEYLTFKDKIA